MRKEIDWINLARFMAIFAVLIDHTNMVLYENQHIAYFSYYSVSLFVLVMGATSYISYENTKIVLCKKILHKCSKIILPYLVATAFYFILNNHFWDFEQYLDYAIHFNASGPFYYVLLYIQLVLVSPILYAFVNLIKKNDGKRVFQLSAIIVGFIFLFVLSFYTTNYTNIMSVYGGGGKLFGGTYIVLLYIGMLFSAFFNKIQSKKITILLGIMVISGTIYWYNFLSKDCLTIDSKLPFGIGFNPPSISLTVYAILMALSCLFIEEIISIINFKVLSVPLKILEYIGCHTLYIFLYHRMFLDYIFPQIRASYGVLISNIWGKRVVYFAIMMGGSIILQYILEYIGKKIRKAYLLIG